MAAQGSEARIRQARFELDAASAQSRHTVSELLAANLRAEDVTDDDIEVYVGCARAELVVPIHGRVIQLANE